MELDVAPVNLHIKCLKQLYSSISVGHCGIVEASFALTGCYEVGVQSNKVVPLTTFSCGNFDDRVRVAIASLPN
jgi:hypothetical protein